jgi:hypothetical protein
VRSGRGRSVPCRARAEGGGRRRLPAAVRFPATAYPNGRTRDLTRFCHISRSGTKSMRQCPSGGRCARLLGVRLGWLGSRGIGCDRRARCDCVRVARSEISMRRSPHELTRAPDPFLGRGFVARSGHPFSRTPRSTAAPRFSQAPPWPGAARHGRLPDSAGRLRPTARLGAARAREPLRLRSRRARPLEERGLLPQERRRAAPELPRGDRPAPGWSLVPLHRRRADQGADRGEPVHRGAALLRPLGQGSAGGRRRAPTARGPVHQDGGDQGAEPGRAAGAQLRSAIAHVLNSVRAQVRVRRQR